MVLVAIAGGSGNLGRALVDAIKAKGGAEVVILARKVSLLATVWVGRADQPGEQGERKGDWSPYYPC